MLDVTLLVGAGYLKLALGTGCRCRSGWCCWPMARSRWARCRAAGGSSHTITGAIVGAGSTRRLSAVRWGVAGRIVWAWVLTIPASAIIAPQH
jgi:hypothetical protein